MQAVQTVPEVMQVLHLDPQGSHKLLEFTK